MMQGDKSVNARWPGRFVLMLGTDPAMRGGIAAVVASIRDEGFFEWARVRYIATHVDGNALKKLKRFASAVLESVMALSSGQVALAHAHVSFHGSFWRKAFLLWIARCFGVPTLFHLHSGGFDEFAARGSAFQRWCIRRTLESSSAVIVLSDRWAAWARGFAPRSRIRVVPNPVRVPDEIVDAKARNDSSGPRHALYLGLICDAKGTFDLLQAWALFRARVPGWRLVIGGNGEVERFLAVATQLGIREDIDFLGWVAGDEKERALREADVFVLPSYAEGMPVSILEAMVYRAVVIATPVGGVVDMMAHERHGLLVPVGDVQALGAAFERLATSPQLCERMADEARAHVLANYSSASVIGQLQTIYNETIKPSSG